MITAEMIYDALSDSNKDDWLSDRTDNMTYCVIDGTWDLHDVARRLSEKIEAQKGKLK